MLEVSLQEKVEHKYHKGPKVQWDLYKETHHKHEKRKRAQEGDVKKTCTNNHTLTFNMYP